MRNSKLHQTVLGMCAALCLVAPAQVVLAQAARSGGNANAQVMLQMQQLAAERTALQTENARLKAELESLRKDSDKIKAGQAGNSRRVQELTAAAARTAATQETAEKENQQLKERTQELVEKFRETVQTLRDTETSFATARNSLVAREQELQSCRTRNTALYKLNDEVLQRLEGRSALASLARAEPFTRLKRIELENLVDDLRSKAEDQKDPGTLLPR